MTAKTVKIVKAGTLVFGGGNPVLIQTMWDKPLGSEIGDIIQSFRNLKSLGCDLIRLAVPDESAVPVLGRIAEISPLPIVADIHFDYRLAMAIMEYPVCKIRINPGNIGAEWKVREIIKKAKDSDTAIRIGVNGGSLPADFRNRPDRAAAMVDAAEEQLAVFVQENFQNLVFSLKSSSVGETLNANTLFRDRFDYPLHLGVTEAGPLIPALIKSSYALGTLLANGIGETIRISISDSPEKEVIACRELLDLFGCGASEKVEIVSCPKCGRTEFDTHGFTESVQSRLYTIQKQIKVAIMGCPVNGPGEAAHADIGITGSGDKAVIFVKGKIIRRVDLCFAEKAFWEELEKLL